MATKKGKKSKGLTLSLQEFTARLDEGQAAAPGQNVIYAPKKQSVVSSWADEVEEDELITAKERIILPSAPRAARGPAYDDSEIPKQAPFIAHLGNLSYDIADDDVYKFFRDLEVVELRLPRDTTSNRLRGFGYVEFAVRGDLVEALIRNEQMLRGRPVRISLGNNGQHRDGDGRGDNRRDNNRGERIDETPDDWRSSMRPQGPGEGPQFNSNHYEQRRPRNDYDNFNRGGDRDRDRGGDYGNPEPDMSLMRQGGGPMRGGPPPMRGGGGGGGGGGPQDEEMENSWRREPREEKFERRERDEHFERRDDRDRDRDRDRGYRRPQHYDDQVRPPRRPSPEFRRNRNNSAESSDVNPREPSVPEPPPQVPEAPKERKKLVLAPRTVTVAPGAVIEGPASIFGGAKPVDTAAREREIEEKLALLSVKPQRTSEKSDVQYSGSESSENGDRGERSVKKVEEWQREERERSDSEDRERDKDSHSEPEDDRDNAHRYTTEEYPEDRRSYRAPAAGQNANRDSNTYPQRRFDRGGGGGMGSRDRDSRDSRDNRNFRGTNPPSRGNFERGDRGRSIGSSNSGSNNVGGGGGVYRRGQNRGNNLPRTASRDIDSEGFQQDVRGYHRYNDDRYDSRSSEGRYRMPQQTEEKPAIIPSRNKFDYFATGTEGETSD